MIYNQCKKAYSLLTPKERIYAMKNIFSVKIGSEAYYSTYKEDGTTFMFINKNVAYCAKCNCRFQFDFYYPYSSINRISCPKCGRTYYNNEFVYSNIYSSHLPYKTEIKITEYKTKLQLKINYKAISLNDKDTYAKLYIIKEIYTFDILNASVLWEKEYLHADEKPISERQEIGYLTDYENLQEKTALWFFSINHVTKKKIPLSKILKILRQKINQKERQIHGFSKRSMYIANVSQKHRLFANILNLAHKVRFWDSDNVSYGDDFPALKKAFIDTVIKQDFEKQAYELMKEKHLTYHQAIFSALSLPYRKNILNCFSYDNLYFLLPIYFIKDTKIADTMLNLYDKHLYKDPYTAWNTVVKNYTEQLRKTCEFINVFYLNFYRNMKLTDILKKDYKLKDIMNLWHTANNDTKSRFMQEKVRFKDLHDWLAINVAKQPEQEVIFDLPQNILNRFNLYMMNCRFKSTCINKYSYLKYVAQNLRNCSAGYKNRISEKLQLVVITDDAGKPKVLLEVKEDTIVQAKLFNNVSVRNDIVLNKLVLEFAKETRLDINTTDIHQPEHAIKEAIA